MSGEQAPRKLAIARGPSLARSSAIHTNITAAIASRVAERPQGAIRTYDDHGYGRAVSYLELWRRSGRIASGLRTLGVRPGAHVVLLVEDAVDFAAVFWACLRSGLTAVPLTSVAYEGLRHRQPGVFREALRQLDPVAVVADTQYAEFVNALQDELRPPLVIPLSAAEEEADKAIEDAMPADPACIIPTSGSTSQIKLVAIGQEALLNRHFSEPMKADQHYLGIFPLDNATGHAGVFLRWGAWTQMPAHLLAARRTAVLDAIERYQITSISLTGSAANAIVDAAGRGDRKWRLESLRLVGMGAETVVPDVLRRLGRFLEASGAPSEVVQTGYGTTETGLLAGGTHPTAHPVGGVDAASLYGCAPGVELRIVVENDTVLAEGDLGEIQARCPHAIFSCYWNDAGATKASFAGDGWWRTGDLGRLQNGELSLHGRTKEILNISGRKFSLAAIDAEIASVVGVGDRTFSCAIHLPGEVAEGLAVAFVPANPSGEYAREVVEKIGRVVRRTYGISPSPVLVTTIDQIPLTANGKLRRSELSTRVQSGVLTPALRGDVDEAAVVRDQTRVGADLEARLADIWRDALNLQGALDRTADFFDLGGDSLRSLLLHTAIEQQFGKQISADAFFARPTFATLLELVAGDGPPLDKDPELPVPWPLPRDLRNRLLLSFEAWDGNRPTRDRLVAGLNTTGSNTPLFWVCQENVTFRQLADCLGATQPVYAFRSGLGLIEYSEDEIQAFALRYASELAEVHPDGSVFVGGCCQGAIIALALAQHLIRRGRHVPLLILADWEVPLQAYPEPVLFTYGRDSLQDNPYLQYRNPDLARGRMFGDYTVVEVPGDHGVYYETAFRQILPVHMQKAEGRLPGRLPRSAHRALLNAAAVPDLLLAGERRTISVVIENLSTLTWPAAEASNLYLANRWLDEAGNVIIWVDGRVPLPKLPPRTPVALSLPITAPLIAGDVQLIIDVVEEGDTWFYLPQTTPLPGRVKVVSERPPPVYEVLAELSATRANVDQLRKYVSELHTHYETSTSWKVTRPLRAARSLSEKSLFKSQRV
jgi:acyl-CoA synthetase (AMP-forming)/AMP-acid ligase II/acyl carrier protein